MPQIIRTIDRILLGGAVLACAATFLLALMLIVEVFTTSLINWSQPWAIEYSGYLLAISMFAGTGWALKEGAHIRVSVLTVRLSEQAQRWLGVLTTGLALWLAGFMTMATAQNAYRSFTIGSTSVYPSHTPLWMPQGMLALSIAFFVLGLLSHLLKLLADRPEVRITDPTPNEAI